MSLRAGYWRIPPSEISIEHKYLRLISKVHSPKGPIGFTDEPAEVFVNNIPAENRII